MFKDKEEETNDFSDFEFEEEKISTPAGTVGNILREAREKLNEELDNIAEFLRIRKNYLKAIEEGRYSELPGRAYVIGFIRSYGDYLGLDTEKLIKMFKDEEGDNKNEEVKGYEEYTNIKYGASSWFSKTNLLVIGIILIALFLIWYVINLLSFDREEEINDPIEPAITEQIDVEEEVAESTDEKIIDDAEEEGLTTDTETAGNLEETDEPQSETDTDLEETEPKEEPDEPAAAEKEKTEETETTEDKKNENNEKNEPDTEKSEEENTEKEKSTKQDTEKDIEEANVEEEKSKTETAEEKSHIPTDYGKANKAESKIYLKAVENVWIQLTDPDTGNVVFETVLKTGDGYYVPNNPNLLLTIGNAGGLEMIVEGERIPQFGPSGAKRSNIKMDPDALKNGTAYLG